MSTNNDRLDPGDQSMQSDRHAHTRRGPQATTLTNGDILAVSHFPPEYFDPDSDENLESEAFHPSDTGGDSQEDENEHEDSGDSNEDDDDEDNESCPELDEDSGDDQEAETPLLRDPADQSDPNDSGAQGPTEGSRWASEAQLFARVDHASHH